MEFAKSAVNWGSVPDWVAGLGSVFAFAAVTFSLWREARFRRADQAEVRIQQARLVFITDYETIGTQVRATIRNASNGPIFEVFADVWEMRQRPGGTWVRQYNNIRKPYEPGYVHRDTSKRFPELGPQESVVVTLDVPQGLLAQPVGREPWDISQPQLFVTFTDSNGLRWERTRNRQPHQLRVR